MTDNDIIEVLDNIRYKNWVCSFNGFRRTLWWSWCAPCAVTGEHKLQTSRQWFVESPTRESVLRTAFSAVKMAELHEAAEFFLYNGDRVFDPHKAVL